MPVIPFVEVPGSAGTGAPAHTVSEFPKLNVGGIFGFTETVKVVMVAQKPEAGVNVYVPGF